jgi:hypothetical protein
MRSSVGNLCCRIISLTNEVNAMRTSSILSLLVLSAVSACTGSPATLAMRPDFLVATQTGLASVSIREAPPDMTLAGFDGTVKSGMESALTASIEPTPTVGPFPERRIVWHIDSMPGYGSSQLVVNVFNGSVPFAYQQQMIDNAAPPGVLAGTVQSMTRRLFATIDRHDQAASS